MKVYNCTTGDSLSLHKQTTSKFTKAQMQSVLAGFFDNGEGLRIDALKRILAKLRGLLNVLETQRDWHFITSSLLLVYDGHPQPTAGADICMIDFAHTESARDQLPDVEYLYGLRNLIEILTCIDKASRYEPPATPTGSPDAEFPKTSPLCR